MVTEQKFKSVSIEELQKENKRMCLSALRVFGRCDECEVMKAFYKGWTKKPCESAVFNKERLKYLKEKAKIENQIKELELKLIELKGGLKKNE